MNDDAATKVAKQVFKMAGRAMGAGALTSVFDDHKGFDPVIPPDMYTSKLPPVADDGTAECWQCKTRLPFAQLDIANEAYVCRPCALRTAQQSAAQQAALVDVDHVKIGRGRWWLMPAIIAVVAAIAAILILR